jgi:hypothetical protein
MVNKGSSTRTSSTDNFNYTKQGAEIEIKPGQNIDLIEKALNKSLNDNTKNNIDGWLKFTSGSKSRHDPEKDFFYFDNNFTKNKVFFPQRPISIKPDQKIFLASVSFDINNVATPMIMGRCDSLGFEKENEIKGKFDGWMDWMSDYLYYIICKNMEVIKGPVKNGISLLQVYRQLKGDIYPSQLGKEISFETIRKFHYRKDRMRITDIAVDYLNKELEKKFKDHGKEVVP